MNNVQTNIMSVAPAPGTAVKTNAAEAVRPVNKTGATADRGTKNSSFEKTFSKLKTSKQDVAEMAEAMGKDPLAASLAASQQTSGKQAVSGNGEPTAEAAEAVRTVEGSASMKAAANGGTGQTPEDSLEVSTAFMEEVSEFALMTNGAGEAAEKDVIGSSRQADALMSETNSAVSSDKVGDGAANLQGQLRSNAAGVDNLAALLVSGEKPEQNLLQVLSGRNLPQTSQTAVLAVDLPAATELMDADVLAAGMEKASLQAEMNLAASTEGAATLPDALLRALAQQPTVSAVAAAIPQQNSTMAQNIGQTALLMDDSFDAKVQPLQIHTADGQDTADGSTDDAFAELFNQQQAAQAQKADGKGLISSADSVQSLEEGAAKTKMDASMQSFVEASQNSKIGSEPQNVPQANPAVTFRTAMQETVEAQPATPAALQKDYEVARQIVEQARLLRMPEQTEMVIRLKPEHLGELTLKVSVAASGTVNAAFHTDNAAVRAIIETSMIQLKHELQAQGLKVDNVGVYAGLSDSSLMNGQQDANAHYAQQGSQGSNQGRDAQQALASFEEEQQALAANAQQGVLAQDGVDYRI